MLCYFQAHITVSRSHTRGHCCSVFRSCLTLVTPWSAAHQAPLSMEFSRQEYWSGWPFPPPGIFPTQRLNTWQADSLPLSHWGKPVNQCYLPSILSNLQRPAGSIWHDVCVLSLVWFFVTPWTITCQASLSMGFSRQEILEWDAILSSRGSSWPRVQAGVSYVFCIGRWILYCLSHQRSPNK